MNDRTAVRGRSKAAASGARRVVSVAAVMLVLAGVAFVVEHRPSDPPADAAAAERLAPSARSGDALGASTYSGSRPFVTSPEPALAPTFDVGAVVTQVHLAYRATQGAWRGGHGTYDAALQPDGSLEVKPYHHPGGTQAAESPPAATPGDVVEGSPVIFTASQVARDAEVIAGGAGEVGTNARGQLEIRRGAVVEQLANGPEGVEQSWRFANRPDGGGDLEVRIGVAAGTFTGETESGLHFTSGRLGIRYGHGKWIDRLGVETQVAARWDGSAIVLRVPAAVVEGSVYPAVLDPVIGPERGMDEPILGPAARDQAYPAVAWDGNNHLLVWADSRRGGLDIYGARVSAAGEVLDPAGIALAKAAISEERPALAWNGSEYLVVWQEIRTGTTSYDIGGARVSATGEVLDATEIVISAEAGLQQYPAVAWDGSDFLVAWQDKRSGSDYDVYGARVSAAGEVLDPTGIAISKEAGDQSTPALAWDGSDCLVVWRDGRSATLAIYGARVNATGEVRDVTGIAISTAANDRHSPAVAWDGGNFLVVWQDRRSGLPYDVYGARVSPAGEVLDPAGVAISTAANVQAAPALAWDGSHYLVAWIDGRSGKGFGIYGARVTSACEVLDASGVLISDTTSAQDRPTLAWDGSGFLVAWEDRRNGTYDVYGARVSGEGALLDATGILIAKGNNDQRRPALAWDGTNYLIVWSDLRNGTNLDVYGARVSGAGALLDPAGIAISTAAGDQDFPALAWNGSEYLVVWQDRRSQKTDDIYGARVSAAGDVLDATGIAISTDSSAVGIRGMPALAWDGTHYLVVWGDGRSGLYWDVYGARVTAAGEVLDATGIAISTEEYSQSGPALVWNGKNYLVVWNDYRSGVHRDVYGARVTADGTVLDPAGIAISTAAGTSEGWLPAVAWDGGNHLVVWMDNQAGNYDIRGARVGADGAVLDPTGIAISTAAGDQGYPALAWDGSSYLVVWHDGRSGTSYDVYGARVARDGAVLDPDAFLVSGSSYAEQNAAVVSTAERHFLVLYQAYDTSSGMMADRVMARTVVLDPPAAQVATERSAAGGCNCQTSGDLAPLGALILGVLALRRRR